MRLVLNKTKNTLTVRFKNSEFCELRDFVMMVNSDCNVNGYIQIARLMDSVRDMEVGASMYVCPSSGVMYSSHDLDFLNEFILRSCMVQNNPPHTWAAFVLKRCPKTYIYERLSLE